MKLEEFETGLARHGADLSLWPERERVAAGALLVRSAPAREAQEAMAMLEDGFAAARLAPEPVSEALLARVMADAADVAAEREPRVERPADGLARRLWSAARAGAPSLKALRPAAMCAAAAVFGLWLGQSAVVADAADMLIDGRAGAAKTFALGQEDSMYDVAFAFLPDEGGWR